SRHRAPSATRRRGVARRGACSSSCRTCRPRSRRLPPIARCNRDVLKSRRPAPCRDIHSRMTRKGTLMTLRTLTFLSCAFGFAAQADAATRTRPGDPGCTTTLQACVDAATAGDRIEIATDGPITESIALHARSLTLTAADGYTPQFLGTGIIANDSGGGGGDIDVRLSRLRFTNGYVTATYSS